MIIGFVIDMLLSVVAGISITDIRLLADLLKKVPNSKEQENDIIQKIDEVKKKLEESQTTISEAISDIEMQKEEFEKLKMEAEINKNISNLTEEQRNAVQKMLNGTLDDREKKSRWIRFGVNLFFCVLSAVIGFILGKVFL